MTTYLEGEKQLCRAFCLLTPHVLFLWAVLILHGKQELLKLLNQNTLTSSETVVDSTSSCQSAVKRHLEQLPSASKTEGVTSLWDVPHHYSVIKVFFLKLEKDYLKSQMLVLLNQRQESINTGWKETKVYVRQAGSPEKVDKHLTRTDLMFVSRTCSVSSLKRGEFQLLTHSRAPCLKHHVKPPSTLPVITVLWGQIRCSVTHVLPRATD